MLYTKILTDYHNKHFLSHIEDHFILSQVLGSLILSLSVMSKQIISQIFLKLVAIQPVFRSRFIHFKCSHFALHDVRSHYG
jgi:hypothetical protein